MSDHDEFEQKAREAGAALRRSAPQGGVEQVRLVRRRRQVNRAAVAVVAIAAVVVGVVVFTRADPKSVQPVAPAPDTTSSTTTDAATPPTVQALPYTLDGIDGLTRVIGPLSSTYSEPGHPAIVWASTAGITDTYLVLHQVPASQFPYELNVSTDSIPLLQAPIGTAVLEHMGDQGSFVFWWRDDVVLQISGYGLDDEQLAEQAMEIVPGSGLPWVLPDPQYEYLGMYSDIVQRHEGWALADGTGVQLSVATGGLVAQLGSGNARASVTHYTVAGISGYELRAANGFVDVIWPADESGDSWMRLSIQSVHAADMIDQVAAAVIPTAG